MAPFSTRYRLRDKLNAVSLTTLGPAAYRVDKATWHSITHDAA